MSVDFFQNNNILSKLASVYLIVNSVPATISPSSGRVLIILGSLVSTKNVISFKSVSSSTLALT